LVSVGAVVVLAGLLIFRIEAPPAPASDPPVSSKASLPALKPDEERYAADLWSIHREVTSSAVAMSFAGIAFKTEINDVREFERRIERLATHFRVAEERARQVAPPPTMQDLHVKYADAVTRYSRAAEEMLQYVNDAELRHLTNAHDLSISASEDMLRIGDILWPGQYKPH
jgi:uncharacterized protein with PhoU and TrkA domain